MIKLSTIPQPQYWLVQAAFAITISLIVLGGVGASCAQDQKSEEPKAASPDESVSEAPEAPGKVDVKPLARDEEIENRLNEILEATQRFEGAAADVENGVVFLSGIAKESAFKDWATDLASSTQDVAAVVNRMSIEEKSIWDFSEAWAELKDFRNGSIQAIPLVIFGLIILVLTWFLARLAGFFGNRLLTRKIPNALLRWVATRAIMLPVLIFGVYLVLRISGLTQLALTVLGGTGLVGLVIGIAFQDIAENFLASILISVQKPFRVGDLVSVDGRDGVVQRVTTRGTTLLTADGNHVQIPNSKIYKATIENFTANPLRRINFDLGIGYDDPTNKAQEIVLNVIKQHSATLNDPAPRVLIDTLGASTVNLRSFVWIDGTRNDFLSVRSSCMRMAKQALLQAGISMPDEAREVIFPHGVPVSMNEDSSSNSERPFEPPVVSNDKTRSDRPENVSEDREVAATEAEGNMESDLDDLKRQAEQSWLPGEGEDVLVGEE